MEKLRELRRKRKITMKELGMEFGVSESSISMYETGKHEPDLKLLIKFADFFGVSTDYILGREDYFGNPYKSEKENRQPQRLPTNELNLSDEETEMIKNYRNLHPEMQRFFYDSILKLSKPKTLENL